MVWNSPSHQLFHLKGKLKKKFTKLSLNFLLSKSPLYKVASIFKICPKIWFSGKDLLNTNISNWNKIVYVLHQLHRKYSHIFATWLWLFSAPPAFQSISTCWSSLISFLQKSLIDCKLFFKLIVNWPVTNIHLSASPTHLLLEVGWLTKPLYTVQFDFGGFQRLQFL